jgi:hypothetical protein
LPPLIFAFDVAEIEAELTRPPSSTDLDHTPQSREPPPVRLQRTRHLPGLLGQTGRRAHVKRRRRGLSGRSLLMLSVSPQSFWRRSGHP